MKKIKEKKHRLSLQYYKGFVCVTFTLCVYKRKEIFTNEKIINVFIDILKEKNKKYNCKNWVYIFMSDHLHLIEEGCSMNSDLWKLMVEFKQNTGYWMSKNLSKIRWQKDFYDHIHRNSEDMKKHIRYILDNPVRKGLVNDWREYSFKGSLNFDMEDII